MNKCIKIKNVKNNNKKLIKIIKNNKNQKLIIKMINKNYIKKNKNNSKI